MSPPRNYPPGLDVSAAKKSSKWKKKKISKKNKNSSKATSSPPSGTSDNSGLDEDVILISEDSEDAVNIDTTENQEEPLSDDHDNVANSSMDQSSNDDIMVSQDTEKPNTDEQIQDEDVNTDNIEDVGSDNEYERQESYLCVQCMTYFMSKEQLYKHEISAHSSYYTQEDHFSDVSVNENIETDVDKESLSDHSEIYRGLLGRVIKRMIVKRVVASLS